MRKLLLFVLVAMSLNSSAQNVNVLDQKNGFKIFHLGDSISKYQSLVKYSKRYAGYEVRARQKVGRYDVSHVLIFADNGIITAISAYVEGEDATNNLHQTLIETYGPGIEKQDERNVRHVEWEGKRVIAIYTKDVIAGSLNGFLTIKSYSDTKIVYTPNENFSSDL